MSSITSTMASGVGTHTTSLPGWANCGSNGWVACALPVAGSNSASTRPRRCACKPRLRRALLHLPVPLLLRLLLLDLLARVFALKLIRSPDGNILWFIIAEEELKPLLNHVTRDKIARHNRRDHELEIRGKRHKLQLLINLRHELGRAREGDGRYGNETPVHGLVLADGLAEGAALVVDCEGGDLLDELEQVDG